LDKSFWTWPFWLGLFYWFFLLNHCDNNIIKATNKNIYYLECFIYNLYENINYLFIYLPTLCPRPRLSHLA
jgi:hypothetical protein